MEGKNFDRVLDINHIPDRFAARRINDGNCSGKERTLSVSGHSRDSRLKKEDSLKLPRGRDRLAMETGQRRTLFVRSQRNVGTAENEPCSSPLKISNASQNSQSSRRMEMNSNIKYEHGNFIGAKHKDKGKIECSKFLSKPPACLKDEAIMDLTKQIANTEIPEIVNPFGASQNLPAQAIRKGKTAVASTLCHVSHITSSPRFSWKGKEKADTCEGAGSAMDYGKGISLSYDYQQTAKRVPTSLPSVAPPRVTGQKRLVRNGCISPHNIATRAKKQSVESQSQNPNDAEQNHLLDTVSNGLPCVSDIREIVAEESIRDRVKGKGALSHTSTSKEHGTIKFQFPTSHALNKVEANRSSDASKDAYRCVEGDGWRSTRNCLRNIGGPSSDAAGNLSRRCGDSNPQYKNRLVIVDGRSGENILSKPDFPADRSLAQAQAHASRISPHLGQRQPQQLNSITKRQRKHETLRNCGECSTSALENSEILCRGSSRQSPRHTLGFSRVHGQQNPSPFNQVIEIGDLSPEVGHHGRQTMNSMNTGNLDSRARQLQEDEKLARELQEQLYSEVPVVGGGETDEHLALALQREEDEFNASSGHSFNHIVLPDEHSSSQPLLPSARNPSTTRRTQARGRTRMSRLRSRLSGQSPARAVRQRNLQFGEEGGIEMSLDMLQALNATIGESNARRPRRGRRVLLVQRDFNEGDYEMLLALDETNHRAGASANQINSLPSSTVQTDNLEDCAVCLEAPAIGDTICHLPCFHKFHKDCIHPWLSRSKLCPVCKSSIA